MNKIKYLTIKISILITLMLSIYSPTILAAASSQTQTDFNLSLGNLCEYVGKFQTDEKGGKNICSFLPALSGSFDYFITPKLVLSPQIGATLPKSGRDENIKRMTFFALANMKYKTNYVNLIGGVGFYFTRISGPGGEEDLNNGNTTDSFPLPKDAVYTRNFITNLGLGLDFTKEWSGELYTYIFNIESNEDRAFSVGANISYHFGEFL